MKLSLGAALCQSCFRVHSGGSSGTLVGRQKDGSWRSTRKYKKAQGRSRRREEKGRALVTLSPSHTRLLVFFSFSLCFLLCLYVMFYVVLCCSAILPFCVPCVVLRCLVPCLSCAIFVPFMRSLKCVSHLLPLRFCTRCTHSLHSFVALNRPACW